MYTATIFQTKVHNRFSAWFFFTTQQYLHMLIYLPARVYNQVYKGKYHFDGVSFETPHWHLPNTGDRSTNHESFPQNFKYTARIKSTAPRGPRCHRNWFLFIFILTLNCSNDRPDILFLLILLRKFPHIRSFYSVSFFWGFEHWKVQWLNKETSSLQTIATIIVSKWMAIIVKLQDFFL